MLIIGCGNRHRGDDAAGILAAERLRELGVPAEVRSGEPSELIGAWSGFDDVILIDAVVTGAPAGTVHEWDVNELPRLTTKSSSTHGLGVAEAIALARTLGRLPTKLRIYGIEGTQFSAGSDVSRKVQEAVAEVVRRVASEVAARRNRA